MTTEQIMHFLRPNGGWIIYDEDFATAQFFECDPITLDEFEQGKKDYEQHLANKALEAASEKAALLEKLGITEDEAKLLLS